MQCIVWLENMKIEKTCGGGKGTGMVEGEVSGVGRRGECGGEERRFGNSWMKVGVG